MDRYLFIPYATLVEKEKSLYANTTKLDLPVLFWDAKNVSNETPISESVTPPQQDQKSERVDELDFIGGVLLTFLQNGVKKLMHVFTKKNNTENQ